MSQLRTGSVRSAQCATFDSCTVCFLAHQLLVAVDERSGDGYSNEKATYPHLWLLEIFTAPIKENALER